MKNIIIAILAAIVSLLLFSCKKTPTTPYDGLSPAEQSVIDQKVASLLPDDKTLIKYMNQPVRQTLALDSDHPLAVPVDNLDDYLAEMIQLDVPAEERKPVAGLLYSNLGRPSQGLAAIIRPLADNFSHNTKFIAYELSAGEKPDQETANLIYNQLRVKYSPAMQFLNVEKGKLFPDGTFQKRPYSIGQGKTRGYEIPPGILNISKS